jgi:hypothetical protein
MDIFNVQLLIGKMLLDTPSLTSSLFKFFNTSMNFDVVDNSVLINLIDTKDLMLSIIVKKMSLLPQPNIVFVWQISSRTSNFHHQSSK